MKLVEDLNHPDLAIYGGVRDGDLMRQHGLFVAESRQVVRILLQKTNYELVSLLLTPAAHDSLKDLLTPERLGGAPVFVAPKAAVDQIVGFHIHQGCMAAVRRASPKKAAGLIDALGDRNSRHMWVALEGVSNPDNIGSIFRNASAFGASAVLLDAACADPFYRKCIRTSMGASLTLNHVHLQEERSFLQPLNAPNEAATSKSTLQMLREAGFVVIAVTPVIPANAGIQEDATNHPPHAAPIRGQDSKQNISMADLGTSHAFPKRAVVLFGNEGLGVSKEVAAEADICMRIPMVDGFDSINVAAASAIALHHVGMGVLPRGALK